MTKISRRSGRGALRSEVPPPRAYLLEGGTIVVGILVALVLGAGWEWLGERWSEGEYVEALRAEFESGKRELDLDIQAREAILAHTRTLLTLDPGTSDALHPDSLRRYSASLVDYRYFTPTHPVLDELIDGGRLEVLQSPRLRRALLVYILERDRLEIVEAREREFAAEQMEPFLVERLPLEPLWSERDSAFSGPLAQGDGLRDLASDSRFRTLMVIRSERTDTALRFSRGLGITIDSVLAALDDPGP